MQTVDLNSLLQTLQPLMLQMLSQAKACWLLLASIQIIYAAIAYMFWGAPKWNAFTYPIVSLVLLESYENLVRTIVAIPDALGFSFLDNALASTEVQWQRFMEVFFIDEITLGGLVTEGLWSVLLAIGTFVTWMLALGAYFLLLHAQYAAVGVLYVVGPFAMLAAATRGTLSYTMRWATTCVECGSWTLILAVLLTSAVKMAESITVVSKPNWSDPESWRSAFTTMGVMLLFGILCFFTPFIARVLVGGGLGAVAGGAGLLAGKMAAATAAGGVTGYSMGGVSGAAQGAAHGLANSAGIRGLGESPAMAAKKADAVASHRDPKAAAAQADAVDSHRSAAAAGKRADAVAAQRSPQQAADWADAVHHLRRTP